MSFVICLLSHRLISSTRRDVKRPIIITRKSADYALPALPTQQLSTLYFKLKFFLGHQGPTPKENMV